MITKLMDETIKCQSLHVVTLVGHGDAPAQGLLRASSPSGLRPVFVPLPAVLNAIKHNTPVFGPREQVHVGGGGGGRGVCCLAGAAGRLQGSLRHVLLLPLGFFRQSVYGHVRGPLSVLHHGPSPPADLFGQPQLGDVSRFISSLGRLWVPCLGAVSRPLWWVTMVVSVPRRLGPHDMT